MTASPHLYHPGALTALHAALAPWRDNHCTAGQIDPDELAAELDHLGWALVPSCDDGTLRARLTARLLTLRDHAGDPHNDRLCTELAALLDGTT